MSLADRSSACNGQTKIRERCESPFATWGQTGWDARRLVLEPGDMSPMGPGSTRRQPAAVWVCGRRLLATLNSYLPVQGQPAVFARPATRVWTFVEPCMVRHTGPPMGQRQ